MTKGAAPALVMDWRSNKHSDWECTLGDRSFNLHKVILGERSSFFEAAFHDKYQASSTDLTELLPEGCHKHIDKVLDYMYGHEITIDAPLEIYKIADLLQVDTLLALARSAVEDMLSDAAHDSKISLSLALELSVPISLLERIMLEVSLPDVMLLALEMPDMRLRAIMMEQCVNRARRMELQQQVHRCLVQSSSSVKFLEQGRSFCCQEFNNKVFGFMPVANEGVSRCRVLLKNNGLGPCYGMALGVARKNAEWSEVCHQAGSAGFATLKGCWGLGFLSGCLFAEGTQLSEFAISREAFWEEVIRTELDMEKGTLRFVSESTWHNEVEIGVIHASFRQHGPLVFAVSTCCVLSTEITVLLDQTPLSN